MLHAHERFQMRSTPDDPASLRNWQEWQQRWNQRPTYATWVRNAPHDDTDTVNNVNAELVTVNSTTPKYLHDDPLRIIKEVDWTNLLVHMNVHIRPVDSATITSPVVGEIYLEMSSSQVTYLHQLQGISFYTASNGDVERIGITASCVRLISTPPGLPNKYPTGRWDARLKGAKDTSTNNFYTYFASFSIQEVPPTPTIPA